MKVVLNKFYPFIIFFFGIVEIFAKTGNGKNPPLPNPNGKPPPPPGVTIDHDIVLLISIALIYGMYLTYNYHEKKKVEV